MDGNDFLYLISFYVLLIAGYFDRKIEDKFSKCLYGFVVGFILSLVLCGSEVYFVLIIISVNAWIISLCDTKKCHIMSFIFTFTYLFYCRKYTLRPFTNVILMSSTLKMVGAAFEVHAEFLKNNKEIDNEKVQPNKFQSITWHDIMFYGLSYIGLLGAPYYTYSTYIDFLNLPFRRFHDWKNLCIYKLVSSSMIVTVYVIADHLWPISYTFTEEFFNDESVLYRIWYIHPVAYTNIFRVWNALVLLECCCCINGLGVYPTFTNPKCGYGPTEKLDQMASFRNDAELKNEEYSFATIENVNILKFHTTPEFGRAIQYWNTTIQYWLYSVIYKNIPYDLLKKPATMFVSSYWHGLDFGYFASLFFSTLVLVVDKRWRILLKGEKTFLTKFLTQMMKIHLLNNLLLSFLWKKQDIIIKYQKSVYCNGIIILSLSYILVFIYEKNTMNSV